MRVVAFLLVSLATLSACASAPRTATPAQVVSDIPSWFSTPPKEAGIMFEVATAESRDLQLAIDKAVAAGRNQLAQQMEVRFQGMTKRFQEEVGLGADSQLLDQFTTAYRGVVSQTINGSRAAKQEVKSTGSTYRVYVLVELPTGAASQAVAARVRANEQLYTRFRATEAFRELDAEAQKFEEFKRANPTPR